MSTKSKRRSARRHEQQQQHHGASELRPQDRVIAGELMGAILAAFSFGALEA